jgi:hypothetical protein
MGGYIERGTQWGERYKWKKRSKKTLHGGDQRQGHIFRPSSLAVIAYFFPFLSIRHLLVLLLDQWSDPRTAELLGGLRRQPCHGDANEMNVLVGGRGEITSTSVRQMTSIYVLKGHKITRGCYCSCTTPLVAPFLSCACLIFTPKADGEHVCALLDFGDLSETYAVAEAAISLTYAMLLEMGQCHNGRAAGAPVVGDGAKDGRLEAAFRAGRALLVSPRLPSPSHAANPHVRKGYVFHMQPMDLPAVASSGWIPRSLPSGRG